MVVFFVFSNLTCCSCVTLWTSHFILQLSISCFYKQWFHTRINQKQINNVADHSSTISHEVTLLRARKLMTVKYKAHFSTVFIWGSHNHVTFVQIRYCLRFPQYIIFVQISFFKYNFTFTFTALVRMWLMTQITNSKTHSLQPSFPNRDCHFTCRHASSKTRLYHLFTALFLLIQQWGMFQDGVNQSKLLGFLRIHKTIPLHGTLWKQMHTVAQAAVHLMKTKHVAVQASAHLWKQRHTVAQLRLTWWKQNTLQFRLQPTSENRHTVAQTAAHLMKTKHAAVQASSHLWKQTHTVAHLIKTKHTAVQASAHLWKHTHTVAHLMKTKRAAMQASACPLKTVACCDWFVQTALHLLKLLTCCNSNPPTENKLVLWFRLCPVHSLWYSPSTPLWVASSLLCFLLFLHSLGSSVFWRWAVEPWW